MGGDAMPEDTTTKDDKGPVTDRGGLPRRHRDAKVAPAAILAVDCATII